MRCEYGPVANELCRGDHDIRNCCDSRVHDQPAIPPMNQRRICRQRRRILQKKATCCGVIDIRTTRNVEYNADGSMNG